MAPGVVLIADAAGHNDPTIGQGLSITLTDVRQVSDALSAAADWDAGIFADYATERLERMRRLRLCARLTSKLRCEFGAEADARRAEVWGRIGKVRTMEEQVRNYVSDLKSRHLDGRYPDLRADRSLWPTLERALTSDPQRRKIVMVPKNTNACPRCRMALPSGDWPLRCLSCNSAAQPSNFGRQV